MEQIKTLKDIDYTSPQGRLLFAALVILIAEVFPKNTPDEVIEKLNEKADSFLPTDQQVIFKFS